MIRDLADRSEEAANCGVCVIGGGVAGLIAAYRLRGSQNRVIVLESGGRKPLGQFDPFNVIEQATDTYQTAVAGRVRALGGTSNAWGGRMMPLAPHDMGPRPYLGLNGWPIDMAELDRSVPEIERLFGLDQSSYESAPASPLVFDDPLRGGHEDMTARWSKWPTFRRRNAAYVFRDMLANKANPTVWLNATVCGFVVDEAAGRLAGVKARSINGGHLTVKADCFILAAGTLETTRLLLLIDQVTDGRAFAESEALGRYFVDHLKIEAGRLQPRNGKQTNCIFGYHIAGATRRSLHLETTARAQREDEAASGYVTIRPEFRPGSIHHYVRNLGRSAQARRFSELLPSAEIAKDLRSLAPALYWRMRYKQMYLGPSVDLLVDARIEQVPSSLSRVTLADRRDPFGVPMLLMDWRRTAADRRTLRSVLRRARRFWRSTRLHATSPVAWSVEPDEDDLLERAVDTRHPAGTARMGVDPRTSVVNTELACHAIPNVFVASAAAFPTSGSANPTLAIMQLALRAAERAMALR